MCHSSCDGTFCNNEKRTSAPGWQQRKQYAFVAATCLCYTDSLLWMMRACWLEQRLNASSGEVSCLLLSWAFERAPLFGELLEYFTSMEHLWGSCWVSYFDLPFCGLFLSIFCGIFTGKDTERCWLRITLVFAGKFGVVALLYFLLYPLIFSNLFLVFFKIYW
jgi:hypothetical protein